METQTEVRAGRNRLKPTKPGLMTFIVNHDGKVFQKDLGKNTAAAATAMKEYNPDKTWMEVKE